MAEILILGGYGNFGKRISAALARHNVSIVIAGRDAARGTVLAAQLRAEFPNALVKSTTLDAERDLASYLETAKPTVVINTCGPFQNKDYIVANICIHHKVHYIDLADGRNFVGGIFSLNHKAKEAGVCVISGASTVPGLSSAVLEHYKNEFSQIDELVFGISPGQKAERGLATTAGILSYLGKRLKPIQGDPKARYGWQDIYRQTYPGIGKRWMANCDIPDLDLFPPLYKIQKIRFSAGMENTFLHLSIWGLSWLVRLGVPLNLANHARPLLKMSHWFDRLGSDAGGMHVIIRGKTYDSKTYTRRWFIVAREGDGPQIPCVPAILLAKKLVEGAPFSPGAKPCIGLISLQDYLDELSHFSITTYEC